MLLFWLSITVRYTGPGEPLRVFVCWPRAIEVPILVGEHMRRLVLFSAGPSGIGSYVKANILPLPVAIGVESSDAVLKYTGGRMDIRTVASVSVLRLESVR